MQIIRAEVPTPFCDHNSATAVTCLLSERKHGIVIIVSDVLADIRGRLIVKILIARHDDIVSLVLIPFSLDALQLSVCIEEPLRNGKIYRVKLVLITRALNGSLCTVERMLDVQRYCFEVFHSTCKRTLSRSVGTVALRIARKLKCSVDRILGSVVGAVGHKLDTGDVVPAFVAVYSVRESRSVDLFISHLELVEQVFIVAVLGLTQKLQVKLHIVVWVTVCVIRGRHLYLIALAARGEVQTFRIVNVDVQPVVSAHIRFVRIAVFHEIDDLNVFAFVKRIVVQIECFTAVGRRFQIVQNVGGIEVQRFLRISDIRRRRSDDAEHNYYGDKQRQGFYLNRRSQNTITPLSRVIPSAERSLLKLIRYVTFPL